jgi:hypothetical protein
MPESMRPKRDLPANEVERMRVLLNDAIEQDLFDAKAADVARRVVELAEDLRVLAFRQRRTAAAQVLAVSLDELTRTPSDEELLRSGAWSEEHLTVLGRIVEVSASNESVARRLLGLALGLQERPGRRDGLAEVVFIGNRLKDLARRLTALRPLDGVPEWSEDAAAWAVKAGKAEEKRDALLHRAPAIVMTGSGAESALAPARRAQEVEVLTTQAWDVLRDLEQSQRDGFLVLRSATSPYP